MTDLASAMSPLPPTGGWVDRLTLPVRILFLVISIFALVFAVGVVIGIGAAILEHGTLKPLSVAAAAAAIAVAALFGWFCWRLSAFWRRPERSAYERRYSRMMVALVGAGLPVGVLLGVAGNDKPHETLFSNMPLDPLFAGIAAATLVLVLGGSLVLYHRSIDDHEQQAYLWANSLAFYFLTLALPAAWLLARGGLIAPIGIGAAMILLLAAFCINFTVWAWLKYR